MRNITAKFTLDEMFHLVSNDPAVAKTEIELNELRRMIGFMNECSIADNGEIQEIQDRIRMTESRRKTFIEEVFRRRLNLLDHDQLVSLVMTGEYPVQVKDISEFTPEPKKRAPVRFKNKKSTSTPKSTDEAKSKKKFNKKSPKEKLHASN